MTKAPNINSAARPNRYIGLNAKLDKMNGETPMTPPADPNIDHLHKLVDEWKAAEAEMKRAKFQLEEYVRELKRQNYSYPVLARETSISQGGIQLIVGRGN